MKKLLTYAILSAAFFSGFTSSARADEAAKQAKAAKLVETMHMEKNMAQMMDAMSNQMKRSFSTSLGDTATPKQKEIFNDYMTKMFNLLQTQLSWTVLKPDMVKLYADNFTEEELDGLINFYSSPLGQSALEKIPATLRQSMSIVQAHIATLQPQVKTLQEDFAKQMTAAAPQAPAATQPAQPANPPKP